MKKTAPKNAQPGNYDRPSRIYDRQPSPKESSTNLKTDGVGVRIHYVEKTAEEAKDIALSAREKAMTHKCTQEDFLKSIKKEVFGFRRGLIIGVFGFVGAVALGAAFVGSLKTSVDETKEDIVEVKHSVEKIEESQEGLKKAFDNSQQRQKDMSSQKKEDLKTIVKEAIIEAKKSKR